jgi:YVTN family beta-propeller protein
MRSLPIFLSVSVSLWLTACGREAAPPAETAQPTNATTPAPVGPPPAAKGPKLFVSNEIDGTVSVIDTATLQVLQSIAVGKRPRGIRGSPDGKTVYVALSGSPMGGPNVDESKLPPPDRRHDGIGVIDVATGQLLRVLQGGTDPEQFAVSKDGTKLFIANEDAGLTTVVEVASGKILKQIRVGGEPEGVDLSPDGRVVYVTSEEENQVFAIDTERLELIKAIKVGPRPRSTGFLPDGSRAFVSAENGASVEMIDTKALTVLKRLTLTPDTLRPMGVSASPDGALVYVTTGRGGTLEALDAVKGAVRWSVAVGERPWGLAVSADGRMVYTANGPSNDVSAVDVTTRTVVARVKVGDRPWGVAIVP